MNILMLVGKTLKDHERTTPALNSSDILWKFLVEPLLFRKRRLWSIHNLECDMWKAGCMYLKSLTQAKNLQMYANVQDWTV